MKYNSVSPHRSHPIRWRDRRGVALVAVLAVIGLITVLIIAFLANVSQEVNTSQTQATTSHVQQLADSVPQIVISRITDATTGHVDPTDANSAAVSWASQPGMIRTFNLDGTPAAFYRLYSGTAEKVEGNLTSFSPTSEAPPSTWDTETGVYTDLNSPVINTAPTTGATLVHFPIVDPRADTGTTSTSISGFSYNTTLDGVVAPGNTPDNQRLPMPVRWLYLLADGTFAVPNDSTNGVVTFASGTPSTTNPIVGRVAFWTDDETAKVNINTASEGTYYDIPRYEGPPDYVLSMNPPVTGEYQRYPGHPATTCLSAVLGPWLPSPNDVVPSYSVGTGGFSVPSASTVSSVQSLLQPYLNLTPRFTFGGSEGGTVTTSVTTTGSVKSLTNQDLRLYSSVDEMLYNPNRTGSNSVITNSVLEKTRFFLTAENEAPEVNLLGLPRVTIWPISSINDVAHRTPQDQLIAFCSTLGPPTSPSTQYPFYFQRNNSKSPTSDYSNIPRNQSLYSYLQNITSAIIPGFKGSLLTKYGAAERDQILTEIFDYIRCCNLNDPKLPTSGMYTDAAALVPSYASAFTTGLAPGLVVPIKIGATKGGGRFPVIDEAFLVFYTPTTPIPSSAKPPDPTQTQTKIKAALFFNFTYPSQGFMPVTTNIQLSATADVDATHPLATFSCIPSAGSGPTTASGGGAFIFFNGGTVIQWANASERYNGEPNSRNFGGNQSFSALFTHQISSSDPKKQFTLVSAANLVLTGDPSKAKWNFVGGNFDVDLESAAGDKIQSYKFTFPNADNLPFPTPFADNVGSYGSPDYVTGVGDIEVNGIANSPGHYLVYNVAADPSNSANAVDGGPVIRSVQLADTGTVYVGGDYRRLSYVQAPTQDWFTPNQNYFALTNNRSAHGLRDCYGNPLEGSSGGGQLIKNASFFGGTSYNPFVRTEVNGVYASSSGSTAAAPGDWDTGFGSFADGAYINRADEGVAYNPSGGGAPYFEWDGNEQNPNLTSPNKQMPSAGMFGSLPTGTTKGVSWQTLLFRPDYSGKHAGQAGFAVDGSASPTAPADFLWLDLFQMPIVEPYAISEPFCTAGRINLNSQIMPFNYITRETGIYAVLKSEKILAIPSVFPSTYKYDGTKTTSPDYRHTINIPETLKGIETRFNSGDIYRSASEICSLDLVPNDTGAAAGSMASYWNAHQLSGDNVKERPYTTIYPRLTTKSNTYTVHFIAQELKTVPGVPATEWHEGTDLVTGEYRGSAMIERYIDPSDPAIPDFATTTTGNLESHYRWRVVNTKRFAP
jgi:uncharacterized protein (TIGR02600 family)